MSTSEWEMYWLGAAVGLLADRILSLYLRPPGLEFPLLILAVVAGRHALKLFSPTPEGR